MSGLDVFAIIQFSLLVLMFTATQNKISARQHEISLPWVDVSESVEEVVEVELEECLMMSRLDSVWLLAGHGCLDPLFCSLVIIN